MRKWLQITCLILLMFCPIFFVVGCQTATTYQASYKTLSVSKSTAEFIGRTAKTLYASGVIDELKLDALEEKYRQAAKGQHLIIVAQSKALNHTDKEQEQKIAALTGVYIQTMTQFVQMAIDLGLIGQDDPRVTKK